MQTMGRTSKPKTALGKRLVKIRKRLDITQEQAAERVFVSRQTWNAWESGTKEPSKGHHKLIDFLENGQL